jgi:D-arabinose 1-dehydrogenase-like Zn-dependent alcohol dehydrogenase
MSRTIVAAVPTGDQQLELREFRRPPVNANDALLRVQACGICGSDVEHFRGDLQSLGMRYPVIPGHEPLGIIDEIGDIAAQRWSVAPETASPSNQSSLAARARCACVALTRHARLAR